MASLTIEQAARLLGCSVDTLRRLERRGLLHPMRTEGGHRRYARGDLLLAAGLVGRRPQDLALVS